MWHLTYQCNEAKRLKSYSARLKHFDMNNLQDRRLYLDHMFLYKLINGYIDSPDLLHKIKINAQNRLPRSRTYVPFCQTSSKSNLGLFTTINRLGKQYNVLVKKNNNIDIFSDKYPTFRRHILSSFITH